MSTGSMKGRLDPRVPEEMRDRVEKWLDRVRNTRTTPEAFFNDPDWPTAVKWARQYRALSAAGRQIQQRIVHLYRLQTGGKPYAVYSVLRSALRARLKRLLTVERSTAQTAKPPCGLMLRVGRFLLNHASYQRYVESHVADIHREYFDALAAGENRRAKSIVVRGYLSVLSPLVAGIASTLKALWKTSGV